MLIQQGRYRFRRIVVESRVLLAAGFASSDALALSLIVGHGHVSQLLQQILLTLGYEQDLIGT
jgi:hypothetical protein